MKPTVTNARTPQRALVFGALAAMAILALLVGLYASGMTKGDIYESVPHFTRAEFSSTDLAGQVTIVNFFASWCPPCEVEHPVLMDLKSTHGVAIYGLNVRDSDDARRDFLQRLGNPYTAIIPDTNGTLARLWDTQGVPETVIIDRDGRIRLRLRTPITPDIARNDIIPLIRRLR